MKPEKRALLKGICALLGGVLMTMCSSIVNAWGTLSIYVASYYHEHDSEATLNMFLFLYPVWCLGNCPGICIAEIVFNRYGVRAASFLAGAVFTAGFLLGAFIENTYLFLVVLGVLLGLGEGLTLMTPVWNAWKYFPNNKGAVTGAVLFGYGFGPSVFGIIFTFLANPHNYEATVKIDHGEASYYLFDSRVADRIPSTLLYFAIILGSIYALSIFLVSEPADATPSMSGSLDNTGKVQDEATDCPDMKTGFKTIAFWQLFIMQFLGQIYAIYIMNVYKAFGQEFITDDHFLSVLGSAGTFAFAVGSFVLPASLDYISFKVLVCSSLLTQAILAATFYSVAEYEALFAVWLCLSFFASGGYFAIFAIECTKVFGPKTGSTLFSFIEQGFAIAAFADFFIYLYVGSSSGYQFSLFVLSGCMLVDFVLTALLRERWTSKLSDELRSPLRNIPT